MLFPTSLVGSYCQPDWLIDREKLKGQFPPRTRAKELWRIPEPLLAEAQDDATRIAIRDQEEAGLDIITDGEIRRESYSNRFATALGGLDLDNYGTVMTRSGKPIPVPRISGPIRRERSIEVEDLKFLRAHTDRKVKITLPGPFTMSQQAVNAITRASPRRRWTMPLPCAKRWPSCSPTAPMSYNWTNPGCRPSPSWRRNTGWRR